MRKTVELGCAAVEKNRCRHKTIMDAWHLGRLACSLLPWSVGFWSNYIYIYIYTHTHKGPVHLTYNPSYSACFFSRNSIFLSQKISQQYFSAGL
jgi:hypothetical protein